ncbi:MAG TPA: ABC transporter permease, partial [Candidatus Kapabacteria bacterium]|nr:ABC transporter permease [Candidatus Kapabacteria bacterium]
SFISLTTVIQNPSSTLSIILSLIPFFSPVLMMGRIFSETPPFWQIALSFAIMIGTFFGVLWVSARIYRTGILMYGKKYSLKEIAKWVKFS